jgi:hypothetical protein
VKRGTQRALLVTAAVLVAILLAAWFLREDATGIAVEPEFASAPHRARAADLDAGVVTTRVVERVSSERTTSPAAAADPDAKPGPTLVVARVTAIETGAPVTHVYVTAWREAGTVLATPQEIETDDSGLAEIEVEPSVELIVSAQGDGRRTGTANLTIPALFPGETRNVEVSVATQDDCVVRGVVLRRDTHEPIAGVRVVAEPRRRNGPTPMTNTANDGSFRIAVRSYATAALRYRHADYGEAMTVLALLGAAPPPLEILLEPGASIRAHVVAADGADTSDWSAVATASRASMAQPPGDPSNGSLLARWTAAVGSNGLATVRNLPARAPLLLDIRRGSRTVWQSSAPITLEPGEVRDIEIRVGGAVVFGVVREVDGRPAEGVMLRAGPAGDRRSAFVAHPDRTAAAHATTDADGAYRLESLAPGAWLVGPAPDSAEDADPRVDPAPMAERVVLASADLDARLDLTLTRGLVIAGRVEHADGTPAQGARVLAAFGPGDGRAESIAAEGGAFAVGPLTAGAWEVFAIDRDGASSPAQRAEAGMEGLVLQIGVPARFTVRVTDVDAAPIANAKVCVIFADGTGDLLTSATDRRGIVELKQFTAGVFHVAATASDARFASQRDVVLMADRAVDVELRLAPAGRARLRFEGPGETAFGFVHDRGLAAQSFFVERGATVELVGPIGRVNVRLIAGGSHEKSVEFERGTGPELVFDGNWR